MLDTIRKYSIAINRIVLFLAAVTIVTYFFPRQGKFGYEYTKGKPWPHSTLIAPFDFPIYKTQAELKAEREKTLSAFYPYFRYNEEVEHTQLSLFESDFNSARLRLIAKYPFLTLPLQGRPEYDIFSGVRSQIKRLLTETYNKGIITLPEEYQDRPSTMIISVVRDNFAERNELGEFYNYPSAYQHLTKGLTSYINQRATVNHRTLEQFIDDLQLNKYLQSNIVYDEGRTEQEKERILADISLSSGVVLSGQRIIDTGELITEESGKILDSLKSEYESRLGKGTSHYIVLLGQALLIAMLFTIVYYFLFYFRRDEFKNLKSISFLLILVVVMVIFAQLARNSTEQGLIYIIPFAILPIIVRIFFDSRLAFFLHVTTILLSASFAPNSFEFAIIQIPIGLVAMYSLYRMTRRSQLVRAAILIVLSYSVLYTGLKLWQEGDFTRIDYIMYRNLAINGGLLLLVYPLIYIFEKLFGFLSDVTLVELSDTNHPILRRLAEKAPGTFQHSIQVGNLAQEAIYVIGGNPMLVRTGAMYHDIGKLMAPLYFTENQTSGINPHEHLSYEESAQIIISHVENGVKMAHKEKLPRQIIDFIETHHGTMKAKYFYNMYVNERPDDEVDVSLFCYPGPTPFTKETAVLMMADSVEAASRSLKSYSDDEIDRLVENIINSQIAENQFIDAPITFKEINTVKDLFKQKLKNIYHARIEYPELKKKKQRL